MTTKEKHTIVPKEFKNILGKLRIYSRNSGLGLEFDRDGYWRVYHEHNEKTLKKYKVFKNAINYLLKNN